MILSCIFLCVAAISSAAPQSRDCDRPEEWESLKKDINLNSDTTIYDVVSFFDTTLAQKLQDNTHFNVSYWKLFDLKCTHAQKTGRTRLVLSAASPVPLEIIPTFMTITGTRIHLKIAVIRGDIFSKSKVHLLIINWSIQGKWAVHTVSVSLTINKGDDSTIRISGFPHPQMVSVRPFIESLFAKNRIPQNIESVMFPGSLDPFSFETTNFSATYLPSRDYAISLYGRPAFKGPKQMSIVLEHNAGSKKTAFGLTTLYSSVSLSQLILQLSGINISAVPVLGSVRPLQTGVMIATCNLDHISLPLDDNDYLRQLFNGRLFKGITLATVFSGVTPHSHPSPYIIHLDQTKATFATLGVKTPVKHILKLLKPEFDISSVSMPQGVPNLFEVLYDDFFYDAQSETIGATALLDSTYLNAFGTNWLGLAFNKGVIALSDKQGVISMHMKLDASVSIRSNTGRELAGSAILVLSSGKPGSTFVHFSSTIYTTLQALVDAFGLSVSLISPAVDATFPKGLSYKFSVMENVFPLIVIPPSSTTLQGIMNIIGYEIPASINVVSSTEITIDLAMVPVNLDHNLFQFYYSENDKTKGPHVSWAIQQMASPSQLRMDGHALLLGKISQAAVLQITDTQYILDIVAPFFLFDAKLTFYAPYGPLSSATFQVQGELSSDWIAAIANEVVKVITTAATNAVAADSIAKARANDTSIAKTQFNEVVQLLHHQQKKHSQDQKDYHAAASDLHNVKRHELKSCHKLRNCDPICKPCYKWVCCSGPMPWGGGCVQCLRPQPCCTKQTNPECDPICVSAKEKVTAAEQVVENMGDLLNKTKATLKSTKAMLNKRNETLQQCLKSQEQAEAVVSEAGIAAANKIVVLGKDGLFSVRTIEFNVPIAMAARGRFPGSVEASILGNPYYTFTFDLQLENAESVKETANDLANMIFPGIIE